MKHTIQTLKKNLTLAEVEALEKELREDLLYSIKCRDAWKGKAKHRIDEEIAREWDGIIIKIKEILGDA